MENEIFGTAEKRLKGTKYWERRQLFNKVMWAILILVAVFFVCRIYSAYIESQAKTKAEVLRNYQITNGVPQKSWTITYKNI